MLVRVRVRNTVRDMVTVRVETSDFKVKVRIRFRVGVRLGLRVKVRVRIRIRVRVRVGHSLSFLTVLTLQWTKGMPETLVIGGSGPTGPHLIDGLIPNPNPDPNPDPIPP